MKKDKYGLLDHEELIVRFACSTDIGKRPLSIITLTRLLDHRHTETGRCDPSLITLTARIYLWLTIKSRYATIQRDIKFFRDIGIIKRQQRYDKSNVYEFNFDWGTGNANDLRKEGFVEDDWHVSDEEKAAIKAILDTKDPTQKPGKYARKGKNHRPQKPKIEKPVEVEEEDEDLAAFRCLAQQVRV